MKRTRPLLALAFIVMAGWPTLASEQAALTASREVVLVPTNHPRLPADLSQLWLAPERERGPGKGVGDELAEALKQAAKGNFARALLILSQPSLQQGTLGHYAEYYKGLAELNLGRPAAARVTFRTL